MTTESDFQRWIQKAQAVIEAREHEKAQLDREIAALKQAKKAEKEALRTAKDVMRAMKDYDSPSTWSGSHARRFEESMHFGGSTFASAKHLKESIESSIGEIDREITKRALQKNDLVKLITMAQKSIAEWRSSMNAMRLEDAG